MESIHQPIVSSTTTTTTPVCEPMSSSLSTNPTSSMSNYFPGVQYLPPTNGDGQLYFQSLYPHSQTQTFRLPFQYPRYPLVLPRPQPNPVPRYQEGIESKAARDVRRLARQRKLNLSRRAADSVSSSSSMQIDLCGADSVGQNVDICTRTPDMKDLRMLFQKVLRKSDVGPLGRIVIPKKEAEKYLPRLSEKQCRVLWIRDVISSNGWGIKYKYWVNNRSRMYLFESAGSFIRENKLEVGDCISVYDDGDKNLYFTIEKEGTKPIHVAEPSIKQKKHAANSKDDVGADSSNSINTQITNSAEDQHSTTTCTGSSKNADILGETETGDTEFFAPYTLNEEDELFLASLLKDAEDEVVTLSEDPALPHGGVEEANGSMDNTNIGESVSSSQPASDELVTLSEDLALPSGGVEEANGSMDNINNGESGSSTQPAVAGIYASSSFSPLLMTDDREPIG